MGTGASVGAVFGGPLGYFIGDSYDSAKQAQKDQEQAAAEAKAAAAKQADLADQAMNKANAKSPDVGAMLTANSKQSGVSSTMLTSPSGVANNNLTLGKTTLLGG